MQCLRHSSATRVAGGDTELLLSPHARSEGHLAPSRRSVVVPACHAPALPAGYSGTIMAARKGWRGPDSAADSAYLSLPPSVCAWKGDRFAPMCLRCRGCHCGLSSVTAALTHGQVTSSRSSW